MSLVNLNIGWNLGGGIIIAIMTIILTPFQVKLLGLEAFGLIGFIATLQLAFTALDLGLSATLTRELAADNSEGYRDSQPLLKTATTVYWSAAALIGCILFLLAESIVTQWLNAIQLTREELVLSVQVIAVYLALRWPVALYAGILSGTQQHDRLNVVKVISAAVRLVGGLIVLIIDPIIITLLLWNAISASIEVLFYFLTCTRALPSIQKFPGFSWPALQKIWRFSLAMNGLGILSVIIVQADRVVVSKLLPLSDLGIYNLAYMVASPMPLIIAAVSSAVMPSLAQMAGGPQELLADRYRDADLIMLMLVGICGNALIFYGHTLITLWVGSPLADAASPVVIFLTMGFWVSAAIANVYNVAVANGRPERFLLTNLFLIVPYVLGLVLSVSILGPVGAGLAWLALNIAYLLVLVSVVHREMLGIRTLSWLRTTLAPHLLLGAFSFGIPNALCKALNTQPPPWLAICFMIGGGCIYLYIWAKKLGGALVVDNFAAYLRNR